MCFNGCMHGFGHQFRRIGKRRRNQKHPESQPLIPAIWPYPECDGSASDKFHIASDLYTFFSQSRSRCDSNLRFGAAQLITSTSNHSFSGNATGIAVSCLNTVTPLVRIHHRCIKHLFSPAFSCPFMLFVKCMRNGID